MSSKVKKRLNKEVRRGFTLTKTQISEKKGQKSQGPVGGTGGPWKCGQTRGVKRDVKTQKKEERGLARNGLLKSCPGQGRWGPGDPQKSPKWGLNRGSFREKKSCREEKKEKVLNVFYFGRRNAWGICPVKNPKRGSEGKGNIAQLGVEGATVFEKGLMWVADVQKGFVQR